MVIGFGNTGALRRVLLQLDDKENKDEPELKPEEEKAEEPKVPKTKEITASISDVLAAQNLVMVSTSNTTPIPNGTYSVPNGRVLIHANGNGNTGFQFVGHGTMSLKDLQKLVHRGLLPTQIEEANSNGINGEIDEIVKQGNTGDCWILAGILSLTATEEGRELIKSSMEVQSNGDVIVNFKGLGYSVRVTAAEIQKHDTDYNEYDAFSNGDNDMLVFELAVEKLFEEHPDIRAAYYREENVTGDDKYITQGGLGDDLVAWLSGNESNSVTGADKLADPYEEAGVAEWVTVPASVTKYAGQEFPRPSSISYDAMFNSTKTNFSNTYINWFNNTYLPLIRAYNNEFPSKLVEGLSEEETLAQLQEAFENQPCAISFGLYVFANDTVKRAKCVDGTTFEWSYYNKNLDSNELCGHAFAVVGMTQDTITFVNPWDSSQKVTMTWEEFAKLGIGRISYNKLDAVDSGSKDPDIDEPVIDEPEIDDNPSQSDFGSYEEVIDYIKSDELKNSIKTQLQNSGYDFNESKYNTVISILVTLYKGKMAISDKLGITDGPKSITKAHIQETLLERMKKDREPVDSGDSGDSVDSDDSVDSVETKMFISLKELEDYLNGSECYRAVLGPNKEMTGADWNRACHYILARHRSDYARVTNKDIIEEMRAALQDQSNVVLHGTTIDELKNTYGLRDSEIKEYFNYDKVYGRYYLKPDIRPAEKRALYEGYEQPKLISTIEELNKFVIGPTREIQSHTYDPHHWIIGYAEEGVDADGRLFYKSTGYQTQFIEKFLPSEIISAYFQKNEYGNYDLQDGCTNFKLLDYNQDTKIAKYSIDVTTTKGEVVTVEFEVDVQTGTLKTKNIK